MIKRCLLIVMIMLGATNLFPTSAHADEWGDMCENGELVAEYFERTTYSSWGGQDQIAKNGDASILQNNACQTRGGNCWEYRESYSNDAINDDPTGRRSRELEYKCFRNATGVTPSGTNDWAAGGNDASYTSFDATLYVAAAPTCTATRETGTRACPNGQTGVINTARDLHRNNVCNDNSDWYDTGNNCQTPAPTCTWQYLEDTCGNPRGDDCARSDPSTATECYEHPTGRDQACYGDPYFVNYVSSCANNPPPAQTCTQSKESETRACPSGQTGSLIFERTLNTGNVCGSTSNWVQTSGNCVTQSAPVCRRESSCGPAANQSTIDRPSTGLCLSGTSSVVTEQNGQYRWTCSLGSDVKSCTANRVMARSCATGGYAWNGSSWNGEGSPNWPIPGWSNGPWWDRSQLGSELDIYGSDGVRITNIIAISETKMRCGGSAVTFRWSEGEWGSCGCGGTKTRTITCQDSEGMPYPDHYCEQGVGARPSTVSDCNDIPASCTPPSQCGASHQQSFMSAPIGSLCAYGTPSAVNENAGVFRWNCSGNGVINCEAYKGCPEGQQLTSTETTVAISAQWANTGQSGSCPAGTVYGEMDDSDSDNRHSLSEEDISDSSENTAVRGGAPVRVAQRLCFTAPENAGLKFTWGYRGCPAGFIDTGIRDDTDPHHNTGEQDSTEGEKRAMHYCVGVGNGYSVYSARRGKGKCLAGEVQYVNVDGSDDHMESDENDDEKSYCLKITTQTQYCATPYVDTGCGGPRYDYHGGAFSGDCM